MTITGHDRTTRPKRLYAATIGYRTPAGRRVLYGAVIAASGMEECAAGIRMRLEDEARHGRRRIGRILDDFHAVFFAMQISSGRRRMRRSAA